MFGRGLKSGPPGVFCFGFRFCLSVFLIFVGMCLMGVYLFFFCVFCAFSGSSCLFLVET